MNLEESAENLGTIAQTAAAAAAGLRGKQLWQYFGGVKNVFGQKVPHGLGVKRYACEKSQSHLNRVESGRWTLGELDGCCEVVGFMFWNDSEPVQSKFGKRNPEWGRYLGCIKRGQFCGPGRIVINDKVAASGEWQGLHLIKSFELDKEIVERILTEVSLAEQAGLSAKLAAAKDEVCAEMGQVKLIEECRLTALAKVASEAEAARQARASKQVVSRPSSSLSLAQALCDVDQARSSSSSDEDVSDAENDGGCADDKAQTFHDAIIVEAVVSLTPYAGVTGRVMIPGVPSLVSVDEMPSLLYEVVGLFKLRGKRLPANQAAELGFYAWSCKEWGAPISQNGISLADMRSIQLDVSNSQVSDMEACAVAELVLAHQKWTSVIASQNAMGDAGAVALISAVRFSCAATIDLSKCGCTGVSCAALADAISGSIRMCEPWSAAEDFAKNTSASAALQNTVKAHASRSNSSDDNLDDEEEQYTKPLANISLEKASAMMMSTDAADSGSNRQKLEKLSQRWPALMQGLGIKRATCCLTKVVLSHNRLGSQGASVLFNAIGGNHSVTHLNLFDCDISERASSELSDMLSRNKRLRNLNLSWNRLRTRGVARLFEGLRENSTLLELLLAWNGCRGIPAFASIAATIGCSKCSLIKLDLANNRINAAAAVVLASGVQRNNSLHDLVLDSNPIGQKGSRATLAAIESASKRNLSVKSANVDPDSYQPCMASMFNCNVGLVAQSSFNPAEPSGFYTLPLEEPYNRVILQKLAMLQFQRKGEFIGIVELNGARFRIPSDDSAMEWQPPSSGTIVFKFKSNRKPPSVSTAFSASEFDSIMDMMQQVGDGSSRMQTLGMIVRSDNCLLYSQSLRVLKSLSDRDEKIFFVSGALYKTVLDEGQSVQK